MMKKIWIWVVCWMGCAGLAENRPNIVLLLSDDQAWTDYGFMGHEQINTPNLDQLAGGGILFERGYVASPLCRPSLASLASGKFPSEHGVTGNDVQVPRTPTSNRQLIDLFHQQTTFIQLLTDAGYRTHQTGKWWEGSFREGGFTSGMTHGDPARRGRHGDAGLKIGREGNASAKQFIDQAVTEETPFFLWYAPFLPHTPHNPPARLLKKYQGKGLHPSVAKYYAMCEWSDEACGDILDYLDAKGLTENTLVLYICDNGWRAAVTNQDDPAQKRYKGDFALRTKTSPFEGGVRSPIIVSWPGTIPPEKSPYFAHAIDFFPTLVKAAGLDVPADLQGVDLLDSQAVSERRIIFGEDHASHNVTLGDPDDTLLYLWAIQGDWKLILRFDGNDRHPRYNVLNNWDTQRMRLYNLTEDPHEKNEVSAEHPEMVLELKNRIFEWHARKERPAK